MTRSLVALFVLLECADYATYLPAPHLEAFAAVRHVRAGTWRPADLDAIRRTLR